ncbi:MAG: hypothetical protein SRB1_01625 [Desulfobacteraceae bacterium Eth-SRB1]|nr:MAG: hypothetical protein SRB1_01625 [Desulfobacteraceae bacterium Eth-SRB1]
MSGSPGAKGKEIGGQRPEKAIVFAALREKKD